MFIYFFTNEKNFNARKCTVQAGPRQMYASILEQPTSLEEVGGGDEKE